jgi:hypothetical protein
MQRRIREVTIMNDRSTDDDSDDELPNPPDPRRAPESVPDLLPEPPDLRESEEEE